MNDELDLGLTETTTDDETPLDLEESGVVEGRDWTEEELAGW